jgi:tryptophan 2-monooxygenase
MSLTSLPKGIHRKLLKGFRPKSMIDTLFDYGAFLQEADHSGAIGSGPATPKHIAIIGAGAAGLVAAYELSRMQNVQVTIFEASDRIGGRMHSVMVPDAPHKPKILEMGSMRYPLTSWTLFHYLYKFDLTSLGNFPNPGKVDTKLFYENKVIDWPANSPTPNDPDFIRIGKDFGNMLAYLLGDANNPNTYEPSRLFDFWALYQSQPTAENKRNLVQAWQQIIDRYKDVTYFNAIYALAQDTSIVERPWDQADMDRFGALGIGSGGFSPLYDINFVEILRIIANGWEDDQQFLAEGIYPLVENFEEAILAQGVNIRKQTKIKKITKSKGQYQLTLQRGEQSESFDSVIVATTTRAMEFMGLTIDENSDQDAGAPMLHQSAKAALRRLYHISSSKLFVTTKTKFWYKENNPTGEDLTTNMQTDEMMRGLYCLDYDMDENNPERRQPEGRGVVLISYVWGKDSTKLLALGEEERYELFLEVIRKINPTFAQLLDEQREDIHSIAWENTPNYYGAFKLNYPGQEQANHDVFYQFQQKNQGLYLAGDSVSWAGGWLEGAMTTGLNAACAAAVHIGAKVNPNSPLDAMPSDLFNYDKAPRHNNEKSRDEKGMPVLV